jgi:hypothetical protein
MPQTIDVSGLPADAVRVIESLVVMLRDNVTKPGPKASSIFDLFGKAPRLRSGEDIERQIQEERDAWCES